MSIGTLFTLFIVPSLYVLMAKDHRANAGESKAAPTSVDDAGNAEGEDAALVGGA